MKKQFILAGLLAVGFASAQTDKAHLGKVGINIMTPQATIDIRPNDDNSQETATTNEGILIPKLSKTRVANIEDTLLVEGTLVYVTDDASSTIASYAGNNAKVTKITEKGYYYYDGTEWVKAKNTPQDQEWVYDLATNRITLKRSGGDLFGNQIFYNRKGGFINQNMISYDYLNASANLTPSGYPTGTLTTETFDFDATPYNAHYKKIDASTYTPTILGAPRHILNRGILYATDTSVDNTSFLIGDDIQVATSPSNTKNYMFQMATYSVARHDGQGDSKYMVGTYSDARLSSGKSTGYVVGGRFTAAYNSNQSSNQQIGVVSNNQLLVNATGEISHLSNFAGTNNFLSQNSLSIVALRGVEVSNKMENMKGTLSITDSRGFFYEGLNVSGKIHSVQNNYGLYIGNIAGGTEFNRAIHTEAGKIRFGDLADATATTDRVVTVDADGVLKVGMSTTASTFFKWVEDATNASVKLAVNSAGTDRTTAPVSITDTGMVKATSFQGTNGATIFPDYVFQKYYTGNSSIKADYTFKSLSQVEDFVKANGHLPGYKSAEAIKAQGYVDLMETQLTNVEKIEELYLHTIELKKENEELKSKNQELESRLEKLEKLLK